MAGERQKPSAGDREDGGCDQAQPQPTDSAGSRRNTRRHLRLGDRGPRSSSLKVSRVLRRGRAPGSRALCPTFGRSLSLLMGKLVSSSSYLFDPRAAQDGSARRRESPPFPDAPSRAHEPRFGGNVGRTSTPEGALQPVAVLRRAGAARGPWGPAGEPAWGGFRGDWRASGGRARHRRPRPPERRLLARGIPRRCGRRAPRSESTPPDRGAPRTGARRRRSGLLLGGLGEHQSTARAARRLHDAELDQPLGRLRHVVGRDAVRRGDLGGRDWRLRRGAQVHQHAQGVVGVLQDLHDERALLRRRSRPPRPGGAGAHGRR